MAERNFDLIVFDWDGTLMDSTAAIVESITKPGAEIHDYQPTPLDVVKAQSADLSHKSDAGGVILNLADADQLRAGWDRLFANVAAYDAGLTLDGALLESMGARGTELIVGARSDPDWGPVILVGFGGVTAEILQDVRLLTPDLPIEAIIGELHQLKQAALLRGFRGAPALDVAAVAQIIATLGRILLTEPAIREIDLNPLILYPEGAVALDALMLTAPRQD